MARFRLTAPAKASLRDIGRYSERTLGKAQRDKYLGTLDGRFRDLAKSPKKGRLRDELQPGLRSYREGSHVVFYVIHGQNILIVNILHERMDPALHVGALH